MLGRAGVLIALSLVAAGARNPSAAQQNRGAASDPDSVFDRTPFPNLVWAEISVLTPPTVFAADRGRHLCYELFITNAGSSPWEVRRVEVSARPGGAVLLAAADSSLRSELARWPRVAGTDENPDLLKPGERTVFYAWVDLPKTGSPPRELEHRVTFRPVDGGSELTVTAEPVPVRTDAMTIVAPPFEGTNWVAAAGPSNGSRHRRAILAVNGGARDPQRFAIDWLQVDENGNSYRGDPGDNRSYYAFGKEIHAVVGGVVTEAKDGIPDNKPGQWPTDRNTLETVAGNHLLIAVGPGRWMMYAHMKLGSVRMKKGDRVVAGQVLGLLGNSGNTPEPRLHLQLMDRNSPLGGQGLPYLLPRFKLLGKAVLAFGGSKAAGGPAATWLAKPELREREVPLENAIVEFVK